MLRRTILSLDRAAVCRTIREFVIAAANTITAAIF
jgi:hypothetical protein